jgi:hypothetical protein
VTEGLKVIIAGSRSVKQYGLVVQAVELSGFSIAEVVCGEAEGPDRLGKKWAIANGVAVKSCPADWYINGHYNKLAGFERNESMGDYADALIAVWDGVSGGTKHMINYMKKLEKRSFVFRTDHVYHDLFNIANQDYWWGETNGD